MVEKSTIKKLENVILDLQLAYNAGVYETTVIKIKEVISELKRSSFRCSCEHCDPETSVERYYKEETDDDKVENAKRLLESLVTRSPHNNTLKVTLSGNAPEQDLGVAPAPIDPKTGMHKDYWILNDEERSKGFIRPLRNIYIHKVCGTETWMNIKIAETYARNPKFYGATYCAGCGLHLPVSEFTWKGTTEEVGS